MQTLYKSTLFSQCTHTSDLNASNWNTSLPPCDQLYGCFSFFGGEIVLLQMSNLFCELSIDMPCNRKRDIYQMSADMNRG